MPRIISIVYTPRDVQRRPADSYARVPLNRATLVEGRGISDDLKGTLSRNLSVMRAETLAELADEGRKTGPGEMGEQLVVAGLLPAALADGLRLRVGATAIVEIDKPRTGCARFEYIHGVTKQSVAGRLGVMARVVVGGEIAVGDSVEVIDSTA
jgi:MOSC domain-containing protein YiiM